MKPENCPKCHKGTTLHSSGREICRFCGWVGSSIQMESRKAIRADILENIQEPSMALFYYSGKIPITSNV